MLAGYFRHNSLTCILQKTVLATFAKFTGKRQGRSSFLVTLQVV